MKASDISLALLPFKLEDMPKIATSTQEPTRLSLKAFQECIQDQAMAITSSFEPLLGFLGLFLKNASFITLSNNGAPYQPPPDPGPSPTHAANATAVQITENSRLFTVQRDHYKTYCEFKVILISMITNNCPEKYLLTPPKHPITKFLQCTPIQLLNHLWSEYGTITSHDLTINYNKMTAEWNLVPTPIEDLCLQLQLRKGQEFETIDDSQLLRLCYDNANKRGLFNDALKIWRAKTTKNYSLFTTYMTNEHEDRMKNQITSTSAGYSANNVSTITDIVHKELEQFVNNMPFPQEDTNDENTNPNVPSPVVEQANATLTASDI